MVSISLTMLSDISETTMTPPPSADDGQPRSERAYRQLLEVLRGSPQDSRLPGELEMAQRLGVSRPVLRQALERLRAEGRIYSRKGSGSFVGAPPQAVPFGPLTSIADVRSFLEFRCNLESEMAALAAMHHDRAELAAIRTARKALERAVAEGHPGIEHDIAFHAAIAQASGNRFYVMTMSALAEQTRYSIGLIRELSGPRPPARTLQVHAEHAAIEKAIAARDGEAAAAAMKAHLRAGILRLFGQSQAVRQVRIFP